MDRVKNQERQPLIRIACSSVGLLWWSLFEHVSISKQLIGATVPNSTTPGSAASKQQSRSLVRHGFGPVESSGFLDDAGIGANTLTLRTPYVNALNSSPFPTVTFFSC